VKNIVGKPVLGEDFFGREAEVEDLRRTAEHQHVLLLAPRRVGKTSLLHALARELDKDGDVSAVYASVAAARSELDFVRTVLDAVYETPAGRPLKPHRLSAWWSRRKHRVKKVGAVGASIELEAVEEPWQSAADQAFAKLLTHDRPWLLMIDELPTLVLALAEQDPSGARVRTFLHWFRNLRQAPSGSAKLRFILAGSIGLDSVTRRYQMSAAINDVCDWRLGPYDQATADRFLVELGASYRVDLPPGLRQHILAQAEWLIPYHLQVVFSELQKRVPRGQPSVTDVDHAIDELLGRKIYFNSWDERLRDTLGAPDDLHARQILTACAVDPTGVTLEIIHGAISRSIADVDARASSCKWIMDVLENDGYLVALQGRWRFRSGLLRRYWQRNYV
jgi:uncharacterized protein